MCIRDRIGAVVENASDVGVADDDYTATLVNVAVPMGSNTIIAEYGMSTFDDADTDRTLLAVGFSHSFSKATSAYVAYGNANVDTAGAEVDTNILTAGMVAKF
jgi:predicted porin